MDPFDEEEQTVIDTKPWDDDFRAGSSALKRGQYDKAETHLKLALEEAEKCGDSEGVQLGYIYSSLAKLYRNQEQYEQAERYYNQVIEIWERTLGAWFSGLIDILHEYAEMLSAIGRAEDSEKVKQRAKDIKESHI